MNNIIKKCITLCVMMILFLNLNVFSEDVVFPPTIPEELYVWDGGVEIVPPDKTIYVVGETLDLTGLEVYGTSGIKYSDGTSKITHREKFEYVVVDLENKPLTVEDKIVTVTGWYSILQTEVRGTFEITVNEESSIEPSPTPAVVSSPSPSESPIPTVVTIEAPKADVESGVVAYGTKVTISPSAYLAYTLDGEVWSYIRDSKTFIIKEDTTISVRSWLAAIEPNVEYNLPEATYTYTVDQETIPMYPYVIEEISLLSSAGDVINEIPKDSYFLVKISLNEVVERRADDCLLVAAYDVNGNLLDLDHMKNDFIVDNGSYALKILPQEATIGSIKAYVWDDLNSMEPLAESRELCFEEKNN